MHLKDRNEGLTGVQRQEGEITHTGALYQPLIALFLASWATSWTIRPDCFVPTEI